VRAGKPAAVVLAGGGAVLPAFPGGAWAACRIGGVEAFRWVGESDAPEPDHAQPARTALHRIFVVPDGEPVESLLRHVSGLSQGERLWFEQGVVAGDTVLVPHEALSDTPAWLAVPRLRRRFRCGVREAAGLAELFLALDAGREVVAWCEAEARRRGVGAVIEELVGLVASLALVEECPETDALTDAERLGDSVELVSADGRVVRPATQPDADGFGLAWHALGSVTVETVRCPGCGAEYEADGEEAWLPSCSACGVVDTWEARQGPRFQELVAEIDGCASLAELVLVGKRLYRAPLSRDQAGVAWTHYGLRKVALEAAVTMGATARAIMREVEATPAGALGALARGCIGCSTVARRRSRSWNGGVCGRPTTRGGGSRRSAWAAAQTVGGGACPVQETPHGLAPGIGALSPPGTGMLGAEERRLTRMLSLLYLICTCSPLDMPKGLGRGYSFMRPHAF